MSIATQVPVPTPEARRAGREVVLELVFRPPANALASVLARRAVAPWAVVVANATAGLLAAVVLARGELLVAAFLLQLKTLLDNTDGQLARVTGRVTLLGRYLDTEADLVVNAAVFAALGNATGQPRIALVSFVALTLVLSADFNATALYRELRGIAHTPPAPSGGRLERLLERAYALTFGPFDAMIHAIAKRRFERIVSCESDPGRVHAARLAYVDRVTVTALANLGLTTQLLALGLCLAAGRPALYLWLVLGCLAALAPLELRAQGRARAVLNAPRAA